MRILVLVMTVRLMLKALYSDLYRVLVTRAEDLLTSMQKAEATSVAIAQPLHEANVKSVPEADRPMAVQRECFPYHHRTFLISIQPTSARRCAHERYHG